MEYVKLGRTGLDVSKLALGCMSYGAPVSEQFCWVLEEPEARKVIKHAVDQGINFFDTANCYSDGVSEEILGRAVKDFMRREDVVISTKVFVEMRKRPNGGGLSRKEIMYEVEQSLRRLGLDYVDILYIHRWDYNTPIEETMRALNDLVTDGKVRYLGASAMYAWQFQKAQYTAERHGWVPFVAMQNHYNLLYREEEREMIPLCKDMGVGLTPYSPLAAGRLSRDWTATTTRAELDKFAKGKYDSTMATDKIIVDRVGELAERYGTTRTGIALAWQWHKGVVAPIIGPTKEKYIDDAVAAINVKLSDEDVAYLEEPYVPHKVMGAR
ncbi:aldo/keto reductase [Veillonella ratti]|uniref:aldo/keto reductase n=1 Tax=Veillonella ratti TaxID=103892 RepID=UPI000F8F1DAD|nr:aldo/keto reductase [Veillonella ratti]